MPRDLLRPNSTVILCVDVMFKLMSNISVPSISPSHITGMDTLLVVSLGVKVVLIGLEIKSSPDPI